MPVNEILTFAEGTGANVLSQADYTALLARTVGFQPGIAQSDQFNKVWRQSAFMSAMIAQFVVNKAAVDVRDDGDLATLLTHFQDAIVATASGGGGGGLLPWQTITATYTASPRDRLVCDTTAGAFPVNLPATPVANQTEVWFAGSFATNNLTVNGNGHGWVGFTGPLVLNKDFIGFSVMYDASGSWRLVP